MNESIARDDLAVGEIPSKIDVPFRSPTSWSRSGGGALRWSESARPCGAPDRAESRRARRRASIRRWRLSGTVSRRRTDQDALCPIRDVTVVGDEHDAPARIFMFLDLKSSTSLAEELGHEAYLGLVNEFSKTSGLWRRPRSSSPGGRNS